MKNILVLIFLFLLSFPAFSQDSLSASFKEITNNGTTLEIEIGLVGRATNSTNRIGSGNVVFTFDANNLSTPTPLSYTFQGSFAGTGYNGAGSNVQIGMTANELTVSWEYTGSGGNGVTVSTNNASPTPVVRITLDVDNAAGAANLTYDEINSFIDNDFNFGNIYEVKYENSGSPVALPVSLTYFNIYKENETSAKLLWETASEENNRGFYLERSTDNSNWEVVNFTESKATNGNSQQRIGYSFIDTDVFKPWASKHSLFYYRLRQQDHNGTEEYVGGVRAIRFNANQAFASNIEMQPNPASNYVYIRLTQPQEGNCTLHINDLSGRNVLNTIFAHSIKVETAHLRAGLYNIQVKNASGNIIASDKLTITR